MHFLIGIMGYLSSPLWLALIMAGLGLTLQAMLIRPEYFPHYFQLFPRWPHFDAVRMVNLFIFSMAVLLTPKALGTTQSIMTSKLRKGTLHLLTGVFVETVFSALYAPIRMLIQTEHVIQIIAGRDSGWAAQQRSRPGVKWRDAWHHHWKHTLLGVVTACLAFRLSPTFLY